MMLNWNLFRTRNAIQVFQLLASLRYISSETDEVTVRNITDSFGVIKSPSTNETGRFKYVIFPFMHTTVLIKSLRVNLSEPDHDVGCDENFITVKERSDRTAVKRYCGKGEINKTLTGEEINVFFQKKSESRSFFEISYKTCSQVFAESTGTISSEEFMSSTEKRRRCFFMIDMTSSMILSFFRSDVKDCIEIEISDDIESYTICNYTYQTFFMRKGPVIIRYNGTGSTGVSANYTVVPNDYLETNMIGREGQFAPRLFNNRYAKNANYTFTIATDNGGKLLVYLKNISIEKDCKDVISVNGKMLCEKNASSIMVSKEQAILSFVTSKMGSGSGFNGYWTTCGGKYEDEYGVLTQPCLIGVSQQLPLHEELTCTYTVEILNTEYIYVKTDHAYSDVININRTGIINGMQPGNKLIFDYYAKFRKLEPFTLHYMGCPRIFDGVTGNITLEVPFNSLIPVGYNCSFIIRNIGNKTTMLSVYVKYTDHSANTRNYSESADILQIVYKNQSNMNVTERITVDGDYALKSYGEIIMTYISGNKYKLDFQASYKLQNEDQDDKDEEGKHGSKLENGMPTSNTIYIVIPAVVVVVVVAVLIVVILYRRKKASTTNSLQNNSSAERQVNVTDAGIGDRLNEYNLAGTYAEIRIGKDGTERTFVVEGEQGSEEGCRSKEETNGKNTTTFKPETEQDQPNNQGNPVPSKCEYSTPWDAKSEMDKITKAFTGTCPADGTDSQAPGSEIIDKN